MWRRWWPRENGYEQMDMPDRDAEQDRHILQDAVHRAIYHVLISTDDLIVGQVLGTTFDNPVFVYKKEN